MIGPGSSAGLLNGDDVPSPPCQPCLGGTYALISLVLEDMDMSDLLTHPRCTCLRHYLLCDAVISAVVVLPSQQRHHHFPLSCQSGQNRLVLLKDFLLLHPSQLLDQQRPLQVLVTVEEIPPEGDLIGHQHCTLHTLQPGEAAGRHQEVKVVVHMSQPVTFRGCHSYIPVARPFPLSS